MRLSSVATSFRRAAPVTSTQCYLLLSAADQSAGPHWRHQGAEPCSKVRANVAKEARVMTDDALQHEGKLTGFAEHGVINHTADEYVLGIN